MTEHIDDPRSKVTTNSDFNPDFADTPDYANLYRSIGLQVVPSLEPRNGGRNGQWKRPAIKWRGLENEAVDEATFAKWYGDAGEYVRNRNLGLITGAASSRVFVIDLDTHKNEQAAAWWQEQIDQQRTAGELETPTQRTGGGGFQRLYRAPVGWTPPTCKTPIGVDIRGQGGFAVLAPSLHESGRQYEWLDGEEPWSIAIADAPKWLCDNIDALARKYGAGGPSDGSGAGAGPIERTATPPASTNAFGALVDGREEYMTRLIWARVVDEYRSCPIIPPAVEIERITRDLFAIYDRACRSRIREPGTPNHVLLEREGRGHTVFVQKIKHAFDQWSGKVRDHASIPRPDPVRLPPPSTSGAAGASGDRSKPALGASGASVASGASGSAETAPDDVDPRAWHEAGFGGVPPIQGPGPLPVVNAFPIDGAAIAPRDWIAPGLALRKYLSVLIAPPGSGKSLLCIQWSIAMAMGMNWGGWKFRKPCRVLLINAEDDLQEMHRRLFAAAESMGVDQNDLAGRIFLAENPDNILIAKIDPRTKSLVRTPVLDQIIKTVVDNEIDVVMADPFAETFEGDENSNSEVKWAGIAWRELARATNSSVVLVHHTRKYAGGMAGEADASRGGGALIGTARVMSTLFSMTEEEAATMGVSAEERYRYVRFDDAKANLSIITGAARWFEKLSIKLPNGDGDHPADEVGVLMPWTPPGLFDGISSSHINVCLDMIQRGITDDDGAPTGEMYSPKKQASKRWAGKVIMGIFSCDEDKAGKILGAWIKSGLLKVRQYHDGKAERSGLEVDPSKRPGAVS